jgi:hypothetical protein
VCPTLISQTTISQVWFSLSLGSPRKSKRNNRKKKSPKNFLNADSSHRQLATHISSVLQSDPPVLSRVISAHRNKRRQTIEPNWFVRYFLASY